MPSPRASSAYPASMLQALLLAAETGEFFIPCDDGTKPNNLRLQFYGLLGALKREGRGELRETLLLTLTTEPPGLLIAWRDAGKIGALVQRAIDAHHEIPAGDTAPDNDAAAALKRILGE